MHAPDRPGSNGVLGESTRGGRRGGHVPAPDLAPKGSLAAASDPARRALGSSPTRGLARRLEGRECPICESESERQASGPRACELPPICGTVSAALWHFLGSRT